MSDWIDVADVEGIPCGSYKVVDLDDVPVAIFNLDGELHAIADVCTHDGGELACGVRYGEEIECPRHGARFNIKTGAVTAPPAYESIHTFPVRIDNGVIQVCDDRWD